MLSDIGTILLLIGMVLYAFIGLCWACAYDQESSVLANDHLFLIGALWPMIIVWMLLYGLFCTINKWYRWATKR